MAIYFFAPALGYICSVRYVFTICLLFIQLLGHITAEAEVPFQISNISQQENAAIAISSFHTDHAAEVVCTIQFNGTTFKWRAHRFQAGSISINNLSNYIPEEPGNHANVYPAPIRVPLVRLLLFPNHYFW